MPAARSHPETSQIPRAESDPVVRNLNELADEIEKLSKLGEQIANSRLKQKAIVLLLHNMSKVGQREIQYILNCLPELKKQYLK